MNLLNQRQNNEILPMVKSNTNILKINDYIMTFFNYIFVNEMNNVNKQEEKKKGVLIDKTLQHDNLTREYLLYVPSSYDSKKKLPLLLNFHGYGGQSIQFLKTADMRTIADDKQFIVVYPQGSLDKEGFPHWNSGLKSDTNKSDTDDLGFVDKLITKISENYEIDEKRIYVTGFSNGSFMAYSLGCYLSDKIAGIGSVAGSMMLETYDKCKPSHPTPMINIHGVKDLIVPYDSNEGTKSIKDVVEYWVDFNKTEKKALITENKDGTIEKYEYINGINNINIEHYKILNGGHNWNDKINFNNMNTSELICNYLLKYDLNGLIKEEPRMCCMAMTKSCLACSMGITEDEFCKNNPGEFGCEIPKKLCDNIMNNINDCLSLLTIKLEYYEENNKLNLLLSNNELDNIDKFFISVMFMNRWGINKRLMKNLRYKLSEVENWTLDDTLKEWKINLEKKVKIFNQ